MSVFDVVTSTIAPRDTSHNVVGALTCDGISPHPSPLITQRTLKHIVFYAIQYEGQMIVRFGFILGFTFHAGVSENSICSHSFLH